MQPESPESFDARSLTEDPIGLTARIYQSNIEIAQLAGELGVDSKYLADTINKNGRLRESGLGSLVEGAGIKRSFLASSDERVFPLLVKELELGTTPDISN